jgi:hypothetical protein
LEIYIFPEWLYLQFTSTSEYSTVEILRVAVLSKRDMFCGSNAHCIILHTFAFIVYNLVKLVIKPLFIAG